MYIGPTGTNLKTRMYNHIGNFKPHSKSNTALSKLRKSTEQQIGKENLKIIRKCKHLYKRKIFEAIQIY